MIGVTTTPNRDPTTLLKMAAASFPPADLVRITAEDTGGGIQLTVISLQHNITPPSVILLFHQHSHVNNLPNSLGGESISFVLA